MHSTNAFLSNAQTAVLLILESGDVGLEFLDRLRCSTPSTAHLDGIEEDALETIEAPLP